MTSDGFIDAHCHLADSRFDSDFEAVIQRSQAAGVTGWIQGGVGPEDWEKQKVLQQRLKPHCYLAFGVHPWWASQNSESAVVAALKTLEQALPEAHFLGECGLDQAPRFANKIHWQLEVFRLQLFLNQTFKKPLILHVVQAHAEALNALKGHSAFGGIVHAFSEGKEVLKKYLDLGFLISVGGAVTRPGYRKLKEVLQTIPLDRLVVETDAPDQTPLLENLDRESRNEPCYLVGIARVLAQTRGGLSGTELLQKSTENLSQLLASSGEAR